MSIMHKSAIKGFKSVDTYMIAMARCIASYLCYLHARKGTTIFYESLLRVPIIEIAQSYKWDYKAEYVLRDKDRQIGNVRQKGAYKKLDYVFAYNDQVIGLEIKFLSAKNPTLKMQGDVDKLTELFIPQEAIAQFPYKYGYVMVVYDERIQGKIKGGPGRVGKSLKEKDIKSGGEFYRKRNILSVYDKFETDCRTGNCCYCVTVQKILERHDVRKGKCDANHAKT